MPPRQRCKSCHLSQKKCDRKRPKCSRCTARLIECIYQPAHKNLFIDQNSFSAELSRRAAFRNKRSQTRTTLDSSSSVKNGPQAQRGVLTDPQAALFAHLSQQNIVAPPSWTLADRVLTRFFCRWAEGNTCLGSQRFIYSMYERTTSHSLMRSAIEATAYADLAVAERHGNIATKSFNAYLTTLHRIRGLLDESDESDGPDGAKAITSHEAFIAILTLDSFELLYIRRPSPLGIHTNAIIRLLQLKLQSPLLDQQSIRLLQSAAPRIQARQLLCNHSTLSESIRSLANLTENPLDIRIARFVAEVCDLMRILRVELSKGSGNVNMQSVRQLASVLYNYTQDAEEYLKNCGTSQKLRRVALNLQQTRNWPFTSTRSTMIVSDQIQVARAWILFHMCNYQITDMLIESQTHITSQDAYKNFPAGWHILLDVHLLQARLNISSEFLLDIVIYLIGLADENGVTKTLSLHDTGLLIVQYPLWAITRSKFGHLDAKVEASELLSFIEKQRNIAIHI